MRFWLVVVEKALRLYALGPAIHLHYCSTPLATLDNPTAVILSNNSNEKRTTRIEAKEKTYYIET